MVHTNVIVIIIMMWCVTYLNPESYCLLSLQETVGNVSGEEGLKPVDHQFWTIFHVVLLSRYHGQVLVLS